MSKTAPGGISLAYASVSPTTQYPVDLATVATQHTPYQEAQRFLVRDFIHISSTGDQNPAGGSFTPGELTYDSLIAVRVGAHTASSTGIHQPPICLYFKPCTICSMSAIDLLPHCSLITMYSTSRN